MSGRTIAGVIIGVILLVGTFYAGQVSSPKPDVTATATATPVSPPKPTIIAGAGLLRRVQALNRLETAMYSIETVVRSEQPGWILNIGSKRILQVINGSVIAGIDLNKLKASDITVSQDNKMVRVQLPPAEVFIASLDSSELYDYDGLPFTSPDDTLLEAARQQGRVKIQEIACRDKILDMATEKGKASISNLLTGLGLESVTFDVQSAPVPTCVLEVKDNTPKAP